LADFFSATFDVPEQQQHRSLARSTSQQPQPGHMPVSFAEHLTEQSAVTTHAATG
jgi:hypothetical protein